MVRPAVATEKVREILRLRAFSAFSVFRAIQLAPCVIRVVKASRPSPDHRT